MAFTQSPTLLGSGPEHAFASCENLFILCAPADTSLELARSFDAALGKFAGSRPAKIGLVAVISGERLPSPQAAREINQVIGRHAESYQFVCVVNELKGVLGTAARGLAAVVTLISRSNHPTTVTGSVDEAVVWMAPRFTGEKGQAVTPDELRAAIASVREQHRRAHPPPAAAASKPSVSPPRPAP